jgi:hypothetical protein
MRTRDVVEGLATEITALRAEQRELHRLLDRVVNRADTDRRDGLLPQG